MKIRSLKSFTRRFLLPSFMACATVISTPTSQAWEPNNSGDPASGGLFLSFGHQRRSSSSTYPVNPGHLIIRDYHSDDGDPHYHYYQQNLGTTSASDHSPSRLSLIAGGAAARVGLAPQDGSPVGSNTPQFLLNHPNPSSLTSPVVENFNRDFLNAEFKLQLVSTTGPSTPLFSISLWASHDGDPFQLAGTFGPSSTQLDLEVAEAHGDHYHLFETSYQIRFSLDPNATLGDYSATFRIVDLNGGALAYGDSNDFTIHLNSVQAVPEPSTVALLLGAGGAMLLARRRRVSSHSNLQP